MFLIVAPGNLRGIGRKFLAHKSSGGGGCWAPAKNWARGFIAAAAPAAAPATRIRRRVTVLRGAIRVLPRFKEPCYQHALNVGKGLAAQRSLQCPGRPKSGPGHLADRAPARTRIAGPPSRGRVRIHAEGDACRGE